MIGPAGDDMVIRPSIGDDVDVSTPHGRESVSRGLASLVGHRGGAVERAVRARIAAQLRKLATVRGAARTAARLAGAGRAVSVAGRVATGARAAAANPLVLLLGALAVGTLAAGRYFTGRPFEGIGADLNELLLGDVDDDARATRTVRDRLAGDPSIARFVGERGAIGSQIRRVAADLKAVELERERGLSAIGREFPVDGMLDMLLVRAVDAFRGGWSKRAGTAQVETLQRRYLDYAYATYEGSKAHR